MAYKGVSRGHRPAVLVALAAVAVLAAPASAAAGISYVGRVASAKSTSTSTRATLKTTRAVARGDALMVSVMLTGTGSGTVSASDPAGNSYAVDADRPDAKGNRLLVLSARNVSPLATGAAITVRFPSSKAYFTAADEYAGVAALDRAVSAAGTTSAFNSGTATTTVAGDLLFGAVGTPSGTATWSSGWTTTPTVGGSSHRIAPAFRVAGAAGPYAASGTASGGWMAALATYTAAPPVEKAPAAALTVTPASGTPPLSVTADASGSTDTDNTPISTYTFDFGDGTVAVGPQSSPSATHSYSGVGTFTVTVTVTDTAGLSSTATKSVVVSSTPPTSGVAVYAGYYDTHHPTFPQPKPAPWQGSANVVFVGKSDTSSGGWDSSAVRVENQGSTALSSVLVTVDIGSKRFALWTAQSVPAGYSLIVTQTSLENFDGSDQNPAGCYGCDPSLCLTQVFSTVFPVVHVTIDGVTTNYTDTGQVLNTHGVDSAGCPDTGGTRNDESEAWVLIKPS